MRPLSQYFLDGGILTAIESTPGAGLTVCVPADGKLVGAVFNTHVLIDADVTFEIFVNDVSAGVDFILPDTTPDESGLIVEMQSAPAGTSPAVTVKAGDSLHVVSGQEQTAAGNVHFTWILERENDVGVDEYYLGAPALGNIEGASVSTQLAIPFAGELTGIALIPHTAIATAGGDHTFDIRLDAVDTTTDATLPDAQADEDGLIMGLTAPRVFATRGQGISLVSGAQQVAATDVDYTYILNRIGEANLSTRDLREYVIDGGVITFSTTDALSDSIVMPESGQIVGCAFHTDTLIGTLANVPQEFRVDINTVTHASDPLFQFLDASIAADEGVVMIPEQEVFVNAGDAIQLRSGGEQIAVSTATLTWIIRR
jgi:hypothetical protein